MITKMHYLQYQPLIRFALISIALISISPSGFAQQPVPPSYSAASKLNIIRMWDAKRPETNATTLAVRPLKDVQLTTAYYDGLGRPLQTVVKQGACPTSGAATDRVTAVIYDEFGREHVQYLPFAANTTGGNTTTDDGLFKLNPFQQQQAFMQQQYAGESWYYGQTDFEASPLNRARETYAPGNDWAGTSTNSNPALRHSIKADYRVNTLSDDVKKWTVTDVAGNWGTYNITGTYPAGELYKKVTTDEQHHQVIEFSDKDGHIILKKVQFTASADNGNGAGYNGWACTYYVYDDLNNLRLVIQPEGVNLLSTNGWNIDAAGILPGLCFRYEYDARKRMIRKKVPGAAETWMVYDARDRIIMTQDGNLRATHQWLYTQYDPLNRPMATGLWTDHTNYNNLAHHLQQAYNSIAYPGLSGQTYEELARTFYDDYNWRSEYGNPLSDSRSTISDSYLIAASNTAWPYPQAVVQSNATKGLVTGTRTKVLGTATYLYSVSFYDSEGRLIQVQSTNITGGTDINTSQYNFTGNPLLNIIRHEKAGIVVQTLTTITYDALGRLSTVSKRLNGTANGQNINTSEQVIVSNEYNALGELITKNLHKKTASLVSADPAVGQPGVVYANEIISNEYKSAEHTYIATKKVHLKPGFHVSYSNTFKGRIGYSQQDADAHNNAIQQFFQSVNYSYNIRGWLSRINSADLNTNPDAGPRDFFGMELAYNKDPGIGTTTPQFNGNISAIKWSTNLGLGINDPVLEISEPVELGYKFTYDALNRLSAANHAQRTTAWAASDSFHENNLGYDLNGNISTLNRKGANASNMDQLQYTYTGNQLQKVDDYGLDAKGFKDGSNTGNDYSYDDNGNMITDKNKAIATISYNHLNLPYTVTKSTGEYIRYLYDASGRKLSQLVYNASNAQQKRTDYIGDAFYENDTLKFVNHEEGRIVMTGAIPEYQYHLKDHLGNVRVTFTTQQKQDQYKATIENSHITAERADFPNYDDVTTSAALTFNHTQEAGATRSMVLTGAQNKQIGLAKSLKVVPGDIIDMEVYAKYFIPQSPTENIGTAITTTITGAFGLSSGSVGPEQSAFQSLSNIFSSGWVIGPEDWEDASAPKAYLNYILFDENFVPYDMGWDQISKDAQATAANPNVAHDYMMLQAVARKPGYLYIYFSNEDDEIIEVYFDDLNIKHRHSAVIQAEDYYPFGLVFNGYQRENAVKQDYLYNGKEFQRELDLEWYDYGARMYMSDVGRWGVIDGKAEKYYSTSSYIYVLNNPIYFIDPDGNEIVPHTANNFKGPVPKTIHDLGSTGTNSLNFAYNSKTKEYDLHVHIGITYTKEFQPRSVSRYDNVMEKDNGNLGLTDEVRNHEEGHRDQIVEGAKMDISVTVNGKEYSGSADKVFTNVVNDVTKNVNAKIDRLKNDLTNGKITQKEFNSKVKSVTSAAQISITKTGDSILGSVNKNINNKMNGSSIENDANNRAAKRAPLQYANGKPIMYNGKQLPE